MTVYPSDIDDDRTIIRLDDNLSTYGETSINQLRSAVFAIEKELGTIPSGSLSSVRARLDVSLNSNGSLKTSALAAAGLVSLPITNSQIATNAGIEESKLDLDVGTLSLQTQINAVNLVANNTAVLAAETNTDLLSHIAGAAFLADGITVARHEDDQIDLSAILLDEDGNPRSATQVAAALFQINASLNSHQNAIADAHVATAISVDTSDWSELPMDADSVQDVLDFIDNQETLTTGVDRATLHSNGVPRNSRVERIDLDGYNYEIIPETQVRAYLAEPSQVSNNDSIANGDDVISFAPDNTGYVFDTAFTQVRIGDIVRINYSNGLAGVFRVKSIRFTPGTEWVIRIDGFNLINRDGDTDGYAYARIDRCQHDINTQGVLAVAGAHADVNPSGGCANAFDGCIIGNPRGAMALGLGFDPGALNALHYNLWLRLYPDGDPDNYTDLQPIDVTGNAGVTPGVYTIDSIIEETNRAFRAAGYNYRFIAFKHSGEFGIMLADSWHGASFTIITGVSNGASISESSYTYNVIGDATDGYDALGLGTSRAVVASPVNSGFSTALEAANHPVIIHKPTKGRSFLSNGARRDFLKTKGDTLDDGYWEGTILTNFIDIPNGTITTTYRIQEILWEEELKPGKSLVVQPLDSTETDITGYGRFIIGRVTYNETDGYTDILVINSTHSTANALGSVLPPGTDLKIYFTEDSVGFNLSNLQGSGDFHRYHEIYVDSQAKTFAIERARIEKQSADSSKINTDRDNWQIRNVSPKMTGYRVDDTFRYWLRFYILDYDATTGAFDGYIGEPDALTNDIIINTGPVTRGNKNQLVRFYDQSNINYIDIQFRELATSPGTIISTPPQYIDIEIFPSAVNDDEVFRLAGVSHNEQEVGSITDLREFGTVSEENFSSSAISFIEAGERYLHDNSVIQGLSYVGAGANNAVLVFDGGIGLVNGSFVAVGSLSCTIPEIRPTSTASYDVFICLTKDGTLRAIPENQGSEFFENTSGELIESYTLTDLIDNHKEYLLLYVASVFISSFTLSSIIDARRFGYGDKRGSTLEITDEDVEGKATFRSLESLKFWVDNYGISDVEVREVNVSSYTSYTFNNRVKLHGGVYNLSDNLYLNGCDIDEAEINITDLEGLYLATGSLKNSTISYEPSTTPAYIANDMINIDHGYAVRVDSNSIIEGCSFSTSLSQRPPFIVCIVSSSASRRNILINMNEFDGPNNDNNCAVCISQSTTGSTPASLNNVHITNNNCKDEQCIVIGSSGANLQGFACLGVSISGNRCGVVGYLCASAGSSDITPGLVISGNTCQAISTARTTYSSGHRVEPLNTQGSGVVVIRDNTVQGTINIYVAGTSVTPYRGSVFVESNVVYAQSQDTTNQWFNSPASWYGILIHDSITGGSGDEVISSVVDNNRVYLNDDGSTGTVTTMLGIQVDGNASITNNRVEITTSQSYTFYLLSVSNAGILPAYVITTGNQLFRGSTSIENYILYGNSVHGLIHSNYLDNYTVDGSDYASVILTTETDILIYRNKNHQQATGTIHLAGRGAVLTSANNWLVPPPSSTISSYTYVSDSSIRFFYESGDSIAQTWDYQIPINSIIPEGTTLVSASLEWDASATPSSGTISFGAFDTDGNPVGGAAATDTIDTTGGTLTAWPATPFLVTLGHILNVTVDVDHTSDVITFIYNFSLVYRW